MISSLILGFPAFSLTFLIVYLLALEPNLVSEDWLLAAIPGLVFFIVVGFFSGTGNFSNSFSPSTGFFLASSLKNLESKITWPIPGKSSNLSNLSLTALQFTPFMDRDTKFMWSVISFLRFYIKLLFPSDLDIWRGKLKWFFVLYTRWSEIYSFFLNCNFNLFPYFSVPPDYRRIVTWRGQRLI